MAYKEFIQNILDTRGHFGVPEGVYKEKHRYRKRGLKTAGGFIWRYSEEGE